MSMSEPVERLCVVTAEDERLAKAAVIGLEENLALASSSEMAQVIRESITAANSLKSKVTESGVQPVESNTWPLAWVALSPREYSVLRSSRYLAQATLFFASRVK